MAPILSILIASNRPKNIESFFENIEETISDSGACEILLKVDSGDNEILAIVNKEVSKRSFRIHCIATPRLDGYWSLWKSYNELVKLASPNAEFFIGLNDECRFQTRHWDKVLAKYINYFPDNIFHLRLSPRKDFKFKSLIEAIPFGESFGIFTKKWVELTEGWAIGPAGGDTGQECVNFFLRERYGHNRGIPLDEIKMANQEDSISAVRGLSDAEWIRKLLRTYAMYSDLLSLPQCENLLRISSKLHAYIKSASNAEKNLTIRSSLNEKQVIASINDNDRVYQCNYNLTFDEWVEIIFNIELVSGYEATFETWPPVLANQIVARRIFAEKILTHSVENFGDFFLGKNKRIFNTLRTISTLSNPSTFMERSEVDPLVNEALSKLGLSKEHEFVSNLLNKLTFAKPNDQTFFAVALFVTDKEFEKRGIKYPSNRSFDLK